MKRKKNKIFWPSGAGIWTPDFWTNSSPKFEFWGRLDLLSPGFLELLDFTCIIQAHFIVHAHFLLHHPRPSHPPRPLSCFCLHCPHPHCPLPTAKFSNHNGTLVCIWYFYFITLPAFLLSFPIKKSFDLKNYFTHHESLAKKGGKRVSQIWLAWFISNLFGHNASS